MTEVQNGCQLKAAEDTGEDGGVREHQSGGDADKGEAKPKPTEDPTHRQAEGRRVCERPKGGQP